MYSDCILVCDTHRQESMRLFFFSQAFFVVVVVSMGCVDALKCVVECTFCNVKCVDCCF